MFLCRMRRKDGAGDRSMRPVWQKDEESPTCACCNRNFNVVLRKHHCRLCGACVCSQCSPKANKVNIPKLGYSERVRVCRPCHECVTAYDEVHAAIVSNGVLAVERALDQGFDPNFSTSLFPPLHTAASRGFTKIMNLLIDKGADITYTVPRSDNAVYVSCETCGKKNAHDYNPLNRYMCPGCETSNFYVSQSHGSAGMNALHHAAARDKTAAIELLLEKGLNVNAKTANQNTALWYAAANGHVASAKLLLHGKADVNATNIDYETPLHVAVEGGHLKMVELLLAHSADIFARNCRDMSPAMLADGEGEGGALICAAIAMHERKLRGDDVDETESDRQERAKRDFVGSDESSIDSYDALLDDDDEDDPAILAAREKARKKKAAKAAAAAAAEKEKEASSDDDPSKKEENGSSKKEEEENNNNNKDDERIAEHDL